MREKRVAALQRSHVVQGWLRTTGERDQTMVRVMVDQTFDLLAVDGLRLGVWLAVEGRLYGGGHFVVWRRAVKE